MDQVNTHAAKTHLSRLLARVAVGETIIISKAGKPVAKLVPYQKKIKKRMLGQDAGKVWISPDFDEPLPDDVLAAFYFEDPPE